MSIAEYMKEVLIENDSDTVGWGSLDILDECSSRCTHTNLNELHPLERHARILNALDRSKLFTKFFFRLDIFQNNQSRLVRGFTLTE